MSIDKLGDPNQNKLVENRENRQRTTDDEKCACACVCGTRKNLMYLTYTKYS